MLTDEMRERLGQLAGRGAPGPPFLPPAAPSRRAEEGRRVVLPAGCEVENEHGRHWLVESPLEAVCRGAAGLFSDRARNRRPASSAHAELLALAQHMPRSVAFLDLETCGLAGAPIFLVGLVHHGPHGLVLAQLLARDYTEEQAVLHAFWQRTADKAVLASFNGKSFDWPTLQDRTAWHGLPARPPASRVHCDMLHHARRRWKGQLPDYRLQTLERYVCGRCRAGDIPGREIPRAYHQFVRSGDGTQIRAILHHNALDLVTLLQLAAALLQ